MVPATALLLLLPAMEEPMLVGVAGTDVAGCVCVWKRLFRRVGLCVQCSFLMTLDWDGMTRMVDRRAPEHRSRWELEFKKMRFTQVT